MNHNNLPFLLVEDDAVDVMLVRRTFQKINVTNPLFIANNGVEALKLLRGDGVPRLEPPPRLILLDLNMPRMGGLEFLRELRADPLLRAIPAVVLTTSRQESDRFQAYNLNVAGYIVKPVTPGNFVEAMATFDHYWTLNELAGS
jgi:CheY-like chemotaxis protein